MIVIFSLRTFKYQAVIARKKLKNAVYFLAEKIDSDHRTLAVLSVCKLICHQRNDVNAECLSLCASQGLLCVCVWWGGVGACLCVILCELRVKDCL